VYPLHKVSLVQCEGYTEDGWGVMEMGGGLPQGEDRQDGDTDH
jgi:hypothetical protein